MKNGRKPFVSIAIALFFISPSIVPANEPVKTVPKEAQSLQTPDTFSLLADHVKPGSLVVVLAPHIANDNPGELSAGLLRMKTPFFEAIRDGQLVHEAILAVPHDQPVGALTVSIRSNIKPANVITTLRLEVIPATYTSETLGVSGRYISPGKADLIQIKADQNTVGRIYRRMSPSKLWVGKFNFPVDSVITSPFGTNRLFNHQFVSFHSGLDLRAKIGTPIHAPAAGKVVLAKYLFFTGYTVILSHGFGVFTLYAHMSKLEVNAGVYVAAGEVLGESGKTGRAKGPHLHWGAVIQGVKVNPLDLMKYLD